MGWMMLVYRVLLVALDFAVLGLQVVTAVAASLWEVVRPREMKDLRGQVAVVTGAGHGIGRNLALQLATLGVRVACWDVDMRAAEDVVDEMEKLGGSGLAVLVDVSDREAVRRGALTSRTQLGEVTLLFNNAGIMPCKPFLSHTEKEVEKVFAVNVFSQFWCVYEFLPRMLSLTWAT